MTLEELRNKLADVSDKVKENEQDVYIADKDDDSGDVYEIEDVVIGEFGEAIIVI